MIRASLLCTLILFTSTASDAAVPTEQIDALVATPDAKALVTMIEGEKDNDFRQAIAILGQIHNHEAYTAATHVMLRDGFLLFIGEHGGLGSLNDAENRIATSWMQTLLCPSSYFTQSATSRWQQEFMTSLEQVAPLLAGLDEIQQYAELLEHVPSATEVASTTIDEYGLMVMTMVNGDRRIKHADGRIGMILADGKRIGTGSQNVVASRSLTYKRMRTTITRNIESTLKGLWAMDDASTRRLVDIMSQLGYTEALVRELLPKSRP